MIAAVMSSLKVHISDLQGLLRRLDDRFYSAYEDTLSNIVGAMKSGSKILVFGNGGSSADASHFAAEFVGRFMKERSALPAISLTAESAALTAIANDYGYDRVFVRQIEAYGRPGDVAIGITTSGKSANVIAGLKAARARGLATMALAGQRGLAEPAADIVISVPSDRTFEVQEVHKIVLHSLCADVETTLFP